MTKKIRIKDIARLAQVSVGTVDRVIHNRGEVAEDSYKRVMDILRETGYKPNLIARTLGSHKSYRVTALIPNPEQDEYWHQTFDGVVKAREEWAQYGVVVETCHFDLYDKQSFEREASALLESVPDGILTAPIFHQEAVAFFKACKKQQVPFVVINNNVAEEQPLGFIGQDLYQSGRLGAELLHLNYAEGGTYAILHVFDDIHHSLHLREKEKGFRDYFSEQRGAVYNTLSLDLNNTHEPTLENQLNELLSNSELRGVVVTTSRGAHIVSRLIERRGKNGLRFVAYDLLEQNIHYLNAGIIDFLINQNSRRQAFVGIGNIVNHLLFKKEIPQERLFPLEVITRQNLSSYLQAEQH
ncbi:MAG TPA: substrate-binding domain-containing protein [Chryseolinea sp.]|nr:substrate-binding domain-containing protein [Chryseolinea sp.]